MAQGDRQQENLETLKLINGAFTTLRLYPEDSIQVARAIEKAYMGTKAFIRKHTLLRFSFVDGDYLLNGEPVDNPTRERIQLLTLSKQLQQMTLNELVLSKGFDRETFKEILSVFSAIPEQIQKAGGLRPFIEGMGLTKTFPEEYIEPGESEDEKKQKRKVDKVLEALSAGIVQPDFILYLLGRIKKGKTEYALKEHFQSSETSARIIASTTYSLLQILHKEYVVVVAPVFSEMLENISTLLDSNKHEEVSIKTTTLLAPYLDERTVLMLICQDFSAPFGSCFYNNLLSATSDETLGRVLAWIQREQETGAEGMGKNSSRLQVLSRGYEKLQESSRGKEILALESSRAIQQNTEVDRKEKNLKEGITALAKGDLSGLDNEEICQNLPDIIENLLCNNKEVPAAAIIQNVVKALKEHRRDDRPRLAQVLGGVAEKLALLEHWVWLAKLTPVCLAWIRENDVADRYFEMHVRALQAMMNYAWRTENFDLAENILNVFYAIRSGGLEKLAAVREVIGHVQDKNVNKALLQVYLDRCFVKPVDEMLCWKIVIQGPVAVKFLLDTLITSEKRPDRIRLLKILSEIGENLMPVLAKRLPDSMPWYGKRNIIRLVAATGSSKDAVNVLPYIAHEDLRVQQEALQCITSIGGTSTENYLIQALPLASAKVKAQLVKNLRSFATAAVVQPLSDVLKDCSVYSGSEKTTLALEISKTLGESGTAEAYPLLQTIIAGGEKQYGKESVEAAEQAVSLIKKQEREKQTRNDQLLKEKINHQDQGDSGVAVVSHGYTCITDDSDEEEIYQLLEGDQKEAAKESLVKLIEKTVHLKQFSEAEMLWSRLIDIDGMAVKEIIKAAEVIEEAKSLSIDQSHIFVWSDLYDLLTTEEFGAFYHALKHTSYAAEEEILKQGDPQWQLFFVNKGRVKLFFKENDSELLVKIAGRGNVFGGSSFFDDSVWTISATSLGAVELSTLSIAQVAEWGEAFPALEEKLQEYCLGFDMVTDFFRTSGAERRADERRFLTGSVCISLLDEEGNVTETTTRGDCSDISLGGLSYHTPIFERRQSRALLGRHVEIIFEDEGKERAGKCESKLDVRITGTVVAVRKLHSAELGRSVHIRFDTMLEQDKMMEIVHGK